MDVFFRIAVHYDSTAMQTDATSWTLSSRDGRHGCKCLGRLEVVLLAKMSRYLCVKEDAGFEMKTL